MALSWCVIGLIRPETITMRRSRPWWAWFTAWKSKLEAPVRWAREFPAAFQELPGPLCYCGKQGCMEMWVSGTGIALDYKTVTGKTLTTQEIVSQFEAGDREAAAAMGRLEDRLARGLAQVINILDPDVIVVGG